MRVSTVIGIPAVVLSILLGSLVPLAYTFYQSVITVDATGQRVIGPNNYIRVLSDSHFYLSLSISLGYTILSLITSLTIGLIGALIVTSVSKGKRLLEAIYTVPLSISPLIAGIVWSPPAVWDDINSLLHVSFGLPFIDVTDPIIYFLVMALTEGWLWSPLFMLASLVIVEEMPRESVEAAEVMGASGTDLVRFLYVPSVLRSKTVGVLMILKAVDFFRAFEIPFVWINWLRATQAGSATDTVSLLLFKQLIIPTEGGLPTGYIAAVSTVLTVGSFALALFIYRLLSRGDGA